MVGFIPWLLLGSILLFVSLFFCMGVNFGTFPSVIYCWLNVFIARFCAPFRVYLFVVLLLLSLACWMLIQFLLWFHSANSVLCFSSLWSVTVFLGVFLYPSHSLGSGSILVVWFDLLAHHFLPSFSELLVTNLAGGGSFAPCLFPYSTWRLLMATPIFLLGIVLLVLVR